MPTAKEIETYLFSIAPKELAMSGDNVGLLVGETEKEVTSILVALDITKEVVEEAIELGAELIVAHHPVMNCKWLPVQTVRDDTPQGSILTKMLQNGVSGICMHTNLDIAEGGVNDMLAQALSVTKTVPLGEDGCGRVGELAEATTLHVFMERVYDALHCTGLRYVDAGKAVRRVAVGGGACWDYHTDAIAKGCDTFVTSDLKYNNYMDAKALGLNVIDAGHFPTEDVVCPQLVSLLQAAYPGLSVVKSRSHREAFQYFIK